MDKKKPLSKLIVIVILSSLISSALIVSKGLMVISFWILWPGLIVGIFAFMGIALYVLPAILAIVTYPIASLIMWIIGHMPEGGRDG